MFLFGMRWWHKKSQQKKVIQIMDQLVIMGLDLFFGIISFSIHWLIFFKKVVVLIRFCLFFFEERIPSEKSTALKKGFKSSTQKCGNGIYRLNFEDGHVYLDTLKNKSLGSLDTPRKINIEHHRT